MEGTRPHKVLLAHPGTQYSYRLARQLLRINALYQFWTGIALPQVSWHYKTIHSILPRSWINKLSNRVLSEIPAKQLRLISWPEIKALYQIRLGEDPESVIFQRNSQYQQNLPDHSLKESTAIIGFDTSSWILAEKAKEIGKPFFLDQSIAHPIAKQEVLEAVQKRFPEWQETNPVRNTELLACENQEYNLADKIIVASSFTKNTLISQGVDSSKIVMNPYGVDLTNFHPIKEKQKITRTIRFVFLGAIMARKGVPLLIEAWKKLKLNKNELWLIGSISPEIRSLIPDLPGLIIKGKQPHHELTKLLQQCDVMVFPSYYEGFAQVLLEGMACGLPIITTEATAAPDIISHRREGFITPAGDLEALCQAMQFFIDHPEQLPEMSVVARQCAEKYSWDNYGNRWQQILSDFSPC